MIRDFDEVLETDKGFQNKIIKLLETSKSPFVLLCSRYLSSINNFIATIPKIIIDLENNTNDEPKTDNIEMEYFPIEDIALLFYIIIVIEGNFGKLFQSLRYTSQITKYAQKEKYFEEADKILETFLPSNLKVYDIFQDLVEVVETFQGNLTDCFSKLQFYKELIFVRYFCLMIHVRIIK